MIGLLLALSLSEFHLDLHLPPNTHVQICEGTPASLASWGRADSVRTYALRLTPGQDPRAEIDRFARTQGIQAGWVVTCVGSLTHASLRLANQPQATAYDGHFEIVSLVGTFGAGGVHLHASLADSTGRVFGGHLELGSRVYTTAEIVLAEGAGLRFDREPDSVTTWRELRVMREGADPQFVHASRVREFLDGDTSVLAKDSRVWYETREGAGERRDPNGRDAFADWDKYWHATKSHRFERAGGDSIVFVSTEDNEFYHLIGRPPSRVRLTYWFDGDDRIAGTLVQGIPNDPTRPDDFAAIKAWLTLADRAYLLPDGRIAPDRARAKRWRTLLTRWRQSRR